MKTFLETLSIVEKDNVFENASFGATNASNIAAVPCVVSDKAGKGSIGHGFDPDGDWGIYGAAKKKNEKATVIRRTPVTEGIAFWRDLLIDE